LISKNKKARGPGVRARKKAGRRGGTPRGGGRWGGGGGYVAGGEFGGADTVMTRTEKNYNGKNPLKRKKKSGKETRKRRFHQNGRAVELHAGERRM